MCRSILAIFVVIVALAASPLRAETEPSAQSAIRQVIEAQLKAFQRDDAAEAFGYASPDLQAKFGSPSVFMNMVKNGYAPVYRPKTVEFRTILDSARGQEQQVFVIGPDGRGYIAHYMMEQQPDGSWRISGCYLEPLGEESV